MNIVSISFCSIHEISPAHEAFFFMSYKPEGPSASSPYAALSASQTAPASVPVPAQGPDTLVSMLQKSATPPSLVEEAIKLEALKNALWAAFKAAPETAIPAWLIDFATAYTNTLRLQMHMGGPPAKPRPAADYGAATLRGRSDRHQNALLGSGKSNANT